MNEREDAGMVSLGNIREACELSHHDHANLEQTLKDGVAQYWLEHGGDPKSLYKSSEFITDPAKVADMKSKYGAFPNAQMSGYSEPKFAQAVVIDLLTKGILKPKEGLLASPFFNLSEEERNAVTARLAKGEPLETPRTQLANTERLAVRAGLKDEVFRN